MSDSNLARTVRPKSGLRRYTKTLCSQNKAKGTEGSRLSGQQAVKFHEIQIIAGTGRAQQWLEEVRVKC